MNISLLQELVETIKNEYPQGKAPEKIQEVLPRLYTDEITLEIIQEVGLSLLHVAVEDKSLNLVKLLLDFGVDVNGVESTDKDPFNERKTPLMRAFAVADYDEGIVDLLLSKANINAQDSRGATVLVQVLEEKPSIWRWMRGLVETKPMEETIQRKVERLLRVPGIDVNIPSCSGETPLSCAVSAGYEKIAKRLLERGADVNVVDKSGETPLTKAVGMGHENMVTLLLENRGLRLGGLNQEALLLATKGKKIDFIQKLLVRGFDVNGVGHYGHNALTFAVSLWSYGKETLEQMVTFLLKKGINIEHRDEEGKNVFDHLQAIGDEDLKLKIRNILKNHQRNLILSGALKEEDRLQGLTPNGNGIDDIAPLMMFSRSLSISSHDENEPQDLFKPDRKQNMCNKKR